MSEPSDLSLWARLADAAQAFFPYIFAIITSGVIGGAFAVIARAHRKGPNKWWGRLLAKLTRQPGKTNVIWVIMFLGFFYAWFYAFDSVNVENYHLKHTIAEISVPKFAFEIKQIQIATEPSGLLVTAFITVTNSGAPASILASSWQMQVKLPDGHIVEGEPSTMSANGRNLCLPDGKHQFIFERSDDLSIRASQTIDRNGYRDGILGFTVNGLTQGQIQFDEIEIVISATDVYKTVYSGSVTMRYLKAHSNPVFMSSLSHPHPELGCSK